VIGINQVRGSHEKALGWEQILTQMVPSHQPDQRLKMQAEKAEILFSMQRERILKWGGQKSHNLSFLKKASGQLFKTDKMDVANPLQTKSRFF